MAITTFLENILETGVKTGWFDIKPIKDIHGTCCTTSNVRVIDFDSVKDRLHKGGLTPASCDCIKIIPDRERIDFIEMKGLKNLVRFSKNQSNVLQLDKEIEQKIGDFDFPEKISKSLETLQLWMNDNGYSNSPEFEHSNKYLIILTDIDPSESAIQFISLNFDFLGQFSESIETRVHNYFSEVMKVPSVQKAANFHPAMLKTCNEIDAYYASL